MQEQATAKEIILAIVDNMHASAEPLLYTTLLPSLYDVYLHNDDYERLQGIWPRIMDETKQALDDELARLNGGAQLPKFLKFLPVSGNKPVKYERAAEDWYINLYRNTDEDTARGDVVIDSRFALPSLAQFGAGSKTKRITTLRSSGQTRTLRTLYQDTKDPSMPPTDVSARAIAKISYEDEDGKRVYFMTKNQIVIGRGGVDYWVDLRLAAPADVSREHIRLKRDEATGQFSIKDLSKFGTSIDGTRIESGVEIVGSEKRDKDIWAPLSGKARIGLADVIFLDFEAL
jgi:hypothetical protein